MEKKFGVVLVGKVDGETSIVAPYIEGRYGDGEIAYTVGKGGAKSGNRTEDSNREFREEAGVDIDVLRLSPDDPRRGGKYGRAKVMGRVSLPPVTYPTISLGEPYELYLDAVVVSNIADVKPHLKGQGAPFINASEQARQKNMPELPELLAFLHERGLPSSVQTLEGFDQYMEDWGQRKQLQPALYALAEHLEQRGLVNDDSGVKLDEKVNPLRYYQEGATVMPFGEYAAKIRDFGKGKPGRVLAGYHTSMTGNGTLRGQLDAVTDAVNEAEKIASRLQLEGGGKPFP